MITIQVNGQELDLKSTLKIKLKSASPFFSLESLPGEVSLPFDIDPTTNNLQILNYPNIIQNGAQLLQEYEAAIFNNGIEFRSGTLVVKRITKKAIRVYFRAGAASLRYALDNTLLTDLSFGGAFEIPEGRPWIALMADHALSSASMESDLVIKYIDTDFATLLAASSNTFHTLTITNPYDSSDTSTYRAALQSMVDDINADDAPIYADITPHATTPALDRLNIYHTLHNPPLDGSDPGADEFETNPSHDFGGAFRDNERLLASDHDHFTRTSWPFLDHANDTTTASDPDYVFPTFYNREMFPESGGASAHWVNSYVSNEYENPDSYGDKFTPCFTLKYIIKNLFSELGYTLSGAVLEDDFFKSLILYNNTLLNVSRYKGTSRVAGDHEPPIVIDPVQHMPKVSCGSFISNITKRVGYTFVFNTVAKTVEIFKLNDVETLTKVLNITERSSVDYTIAPQERKSGAYITLADPKNDSEATSTFVRSSKYAPVAVVDTAASLPTDTSVIGSDDIAFVEDVFQYYRATVSGTVTWSYEATLIDELKAGNEEIKVQSDFVPISVTNYYNGAHTWLIPVVEEAVNHYENYINAGEYGVTDEPYDLRLLVWQGLQENSNGDEYPLASVENKDYAGTVLNTHSLTYRGDNGVYIRNFSNWVELQNNLKAVEFNALFNLYQKLVFDYSYHLYAFNSRLAPADITFELSNKEASVVSLVTYKV